MLPDLLVIGAMKSGTTSLWASLARHQQVHMAARKEVRFFDRDDRFARGAGWCAEQFAGATGEHRAVGEATPSYSRWPQWLDVPARAASVVPGARLLYILRDPVERARSHYLHLRGIGLEDLPFGRAVRERRTYVDTGRYAMQLDRWLQHYPQDRVLLLTTEQLRDQPTATLAGVHAFLGLAGPALVAMAPLHVTDDAVRQRPAVHRLKRTSPCRRLIDTAPPSLRPALRTLDPVLRHRPAAAGADLALELRAVLGDLLRDDVARLHPRMPAGWDGWGLA